MEQLKRYTSSGYSSKSRLYDPKETIGPSRERQRWFTEIAEPEAERVLGSDVDRLSIDIVGSAHPTQNAALPDSDLDLLITNTGRTTPRETDYLALIVNSALRSLPQPPFRLDIHIDHDYAEDH